MSLSIPLLEFSHLRLIAKTGPAGSISLSFQTLEGVSQTPKDFHVPHVSLHFDCTCENGVSALSVYLSFSTPPCEEESKSQTTQAASGGPAGAQLNDNVLMGLPEQLGFVWPEIPTAASFAQLPLPTRLADSSAGFLPLGTGHDDPADRLSANCMAQCQYDLSTFFMNEYAVSQMPGAMSATAEWSEAHLAAPQSVGQQVDALPTSPTSTFVAPSDASKMSLDCSTDCFLPAHSPSPPVASGSVDSPSPCDSDSSRHSECGIVSCPRRNCKRRFASEHMREKHILTHTPKVKRIFPCTFPCPEVFSRKHDRMRHEVTQHGSKCKWVCDKCRKFFATENTLGKHRCQCSGRAGYARWVAPSGSGTTSE